MNEVSIFYLANIICHFLPVLQFVVSRRPRGVVQCSQLQSILGFSIISVWEGYQRKLPVSMLTKNPRIYLEENHEVSESA
jgi:hypothetical protein